MTKPEEAASAEAVAKENAKTIAFEKGPPDPKAAAAVKESNDSEFENEKEQQDGKDD